MLVTITWVERNRYRDSVVVSEESIRAAGLNPESSEDVLEYLRANESEWVERIDDFNAAHQAVEERDLVEVTEIDAKSGVLAI